MKKTLALLALLTAPLLADNLWKTYEEAAQADQRKTVVAVLERVYTRACEAKDWDEAFFTLGHKSVLEGKAGEDERTYSVISRLEKLQQNAPAEIKPLLAALSVEWYRQYFKSNRYKFSSRTQVDGTDEGTQIDAWSLPRLLREIDQRYTALLKDPDALAHYPAEQFLLSFPPQNDNDIMEEVAESIRDYTIFEECEEKVVEVEPEEPDDANPGAWRRRKPGISNIYRPTLYDIIAHCAIDFYATAECDLADVDYKAKALALFDTLAAWHQQHGNALPYANICLEKLLFQRNLAESKSPDKDAAAEKSVEALNKFIEANLGNEVSARALAALGEKLYKRKQYAKAMDTVERSTTHFSHSCGAKECYAIAQKIKAPSFSLKSQDVWALSKPEVQPFGTIQITARNVRKIYFRLYPHVRDLSTPDISWDSLYADDMKALCKADPLQEFDADIPANMSYEEVNYTFNVPQPIKSGTYYLVASLRKDFACGYNISNNIMDCRRIQITDLALDLAAIGNEWVVNVFQSDTGNPMTNTTVTFVYSAGNPEQRLQINQVWTDQYGQARFDRTERTLHYIRAQAGGDVAVLATENSWSYSSPKDKKVTRVVLLTDRAIYRPGQTVHYKGIYYTADPTEGIYEVRPDAEFTIRLKDANDQDIDSRKERTNAFGSFSGSFVIPEGRSTGRFSLNMDHGSVSFRVEEYKRPKFEVVFDIVKDEYRLGDKAVVTGRVHSYSGLPVAHAKIKWSVHREPPSPRRYYMNQEPKDELIARDEVQTDKEGVYRITFDALAPEDANPAENPTYSFRVKAEVVDVSGETRKASETITLGFTSLKVAITPAQWVEANQPTEVKLQTVNLSWKPVPAKGTLLIHKLQPPKRPTPATNGSKDSQAPNDPLTWPIAKTLFKLPFQTDATGKTTIDVTLPAGVYLLEAQAKDRFGTPVTSKETVFVYDLKATASTIGVPFKLGIKDQSIEPGGILTAVLGSGYPTAYCQAELYRNGKLLKHWANKPDNTQLVIKYPVTEELRGGFMLRTMMVREGVKYEKSYFIDVPWSNKQLKLEWLHIRSKLEPDDKEKWLLSVKRHDGSPAVAEVIGCMYDISLDIFIRPLWQCFSGFASGYANYPNKFIIGESRPNYGQTPSLTSWDMPWQTWNDYMLRDSYAWRSLIFLNSSPIKMRNVFGSRNPGMRGSIISCGDGEAIHSHSAFFPHGLYSTRDTNAKHAVNIRRNLSETAFFLPHQETDVDGNAVFAFTAPEALTGWKVRVLAHERDLSSGYLEAETVTQRRLMLEPNFPRFLREGDVIELPVKLTNTSETNQAGQVSLVLRDGRSGEVNTALFVAEGAEQAFTLKPGESKAFSWKVKVPEQAAGLLQYTLLAKGTDCGDGEEAFLPVLSKRIQLTESLAFTVRPNQDKTFEMKRLLNMAELKGIENINLKLEVTPNAVWSAVLALPYLMEYPHECAEQLFHRYYANTLARHILQENPKIEEVFKRWQALNEGALKSSLEKNQELKRLLIEETPWLKAALKESEQRRDIALLFDKDRAERERKQIIARLRVMRNNNGLWPWFAGGPENHWVSLKIVTGVGHLRKLGVKDIDLELIRNAVVQLDNRCYNRVKTAKDNKEALSAGMDDVNYLYARTFFMEEIKLSDLNEPALREMLKAAAEGWQKFPLYTRAQLAIALFRFGDAETAKLICKSMQENAVESEELGMYWKLTRSWWWYEAPIETQAMAMEAFREVTQDQKLVDECALWLLQQKRTSRWPTTVSTAHAVYAILLSSNAPLSDSAAVQVKLGGELIEPAKAEPGSGYFSESFAKDKIKPELGRIEVNNPHNRVVFGGLHWQYLQDIGEVTASDDALPLRIERELFKREVTAAGNVLKPLDVALQQGDTVVTRIELRVDRDLEFVHLKDTRAASLEPVDVLSSYRWQDGVGYFQSTRDTATHFFFDRLPRGTYVFEYDCSVFQNGTCNAGLAEVQCMYAPEFNAHSKGCTLISK